MLSIHLISAVPPSSEAVPAVHSSRIRVIRGDKYDGGWWIHAGQVQHAAREAEFGPPHCSQGLNPSLETLGAIIITHFANFLLFFGVLQGGDSVGAALVREDCTLTAAEIVEMLQRRRCRHYPPTTSPGPPNHPPTRAHGGNPPSGVADPAPLHHSFFAVVPLRKAPLPLEAPRAVC